MIEEFGLARDAATCRGGDDGEDDFVRRMCEHAAGKREVAGVAVWAWGGEGRPKQREMARGDAWIGDPPHEPQDGTVCTTTTRRRSPRLWSARA